MQFEIDLVLGVPIVAAQGHPVFGCAAGKIIFREIGPIDRCRLIVAEHRNTSGEAAPAQHLRGSKTGGAATDDDKSFACPGLVGSGLRLLVFDENLAVLFFDRPAGHRGQGRRCNSFAGLQVEVRMVPRAADRLAHEQTVGEGPVVVRAIRRKREELAALAHEQNLIVTDVACQHRSPGEFGGRDAS